MATDLFGKYYNNPTKSYLYTNLTCNGESADEMSFDIIGSDGVISNNENMLTKIDLSEVHVPLTQYTNEMRIIDPYSFIYVRGITCGPSYTTKSYGLIKRSILKDKYWMDNCAVRFLFEYSKGNGIYTVLDVNVFGNENYDILELIQTKFDDEKIPVNVTYKDRHLIFTTTELGFEFWIRCILVDNTEMKIYASDEDESEWTGEVNSDAYEWVNDPLSCVLFEDDYLFVPHHKYSNGAMKGCVVLATYPQFNAENIPDTQHSLKIVHLTNRVTDMAPNRILYNDNVQTYLKVYKDVVDTFYSRFEEEFFAKWSNETLTFDDNRPYFRKREDRDMWIDANNPPYQDIFSKKWKTIDMESIGLYGYISYAALNGLWSSMGQLYIKTTVDDDESENTSNLIPSFIIYNPNSFPVRVKYMTFV